MIPNRTVPVEVAQDRITLRDGFHGPFWKVLKAELVHRREHEVNLLVGSTRTIEEVRFSQGLIAGLDVLLGIEASYANKST